VASKRLYNDRYVDPTCARSPLLGHHTEVVVLARREFLQTAAGAALGAAAAAVAPQLTAHVNAAPQREGTGHGASCPTS
jgi:hypothetical protein